MGSQAAAPLQKLPWRRQATSRERFGLLPCWRVVSRAAGIFTGRSEGQEGERRERIFVFGGPKPKIFPSKESRRGGARDAAADSLAAARPPKLSPLLALPISRSSCEKISSARGGLTPLRKLLRFELRVGSPRQMESWDSAGPRRSDHHQKVASILKTFSSGRSVGALRTLAQLLRRALTFVLDATYTLSKTGVTCT